MSLYNLLHGYNANAGPIIRALGIELARIERFRDAAFAKDGDAHVIRILCRTGGPNRPAHPNTVLTSHPLYLRDHDDDFDSTYAYYYFQIPKEVLDTLARVGLSLDDVTETETLREKTLRAAEEMRGK